MQYLSPKTLFSIFNADIESFISLDFNQIKKRALAEFELSGKLTINVNSKELSKNDILQLIDQYKLSDELDFHLKIAEIPELLIFLEKNHPSGKLSFSAPCFNDEKFIRFLSPFLANSLGIFYASCIDNPQLTIQFASRIKFPILQEHVHLITEQVNQKISKNISALNMIELKFKLDVRYPDSSIYFKNDLIRILNLLPKEYFANQVDNYALAGIKFIRTFFTTRIQRFVYINQITFLYKQLAKLVVSKHVKEELGSLDIYFNPIDSDLSPIDVKEMEERRWWLVISILIGILIPFFLMMIYDKPEDRKAKNVTYPSREEVIKMWENIRLETDTIEIEYPVEILKKK
jgi:hypothetical protein